MHMVLRSRVIFDNGAQKIVIESGDENATHSDERVIINNGAQKIVIESGGGNATHSDELSIRGGSADLHGTSRVYRGFLEVVYQGCLMVIGTLLWIFKHVFWFLMGALTGLMWAVTRKRK